MIVATAGHIDHGKTLLVKALTGVDADRLPEEKRRGMTIDLGFAYLPDAAGTIGFVDVPGHERFIHNMLCGVAGIDCALLVVAADDGPMPQTVEHVSILDLLGIRSALVALTKTDRVPTERVAQVHGAISALLDGTSLEGAPVFPVCAPSGDGIQPLARALRALAAKLPRRAEQGKFRLAVDRVFSVAGAGLVVTGTVFSGSVGTGDMVRVLRDGREARVRTVHAQNARAERGQAGERCALNLGGLRTEHVERGDWIVAGALPAPVMKFDARMRLLRSETRPLAHWTPVHVHVAAAEATGRVAILGGDEMAPGARALVQIVLDRPLGVLYGDRVVLRDQSARRTLGGGHVIDAFPPARGRARPGRIEFLNALDDADPLRALTGCLALAARSAKQGVDLERFARLRNLRSAEADALFAQVPMRRVETGSVRYGFSDTHWAALRKRAAGNVAQWLQRVPDASGMPEDRLLGDRAVPALVSGALAAELVAEGILVRDGSHLRLPQHKPVFAAADAALWERLMAMLETERARPPTVAELAARVPVAAKAATALFERAARHGLVVRVSDSRYFTPDAVVGLASIAAQIASSAPDGRFTAAQFRDASALGRNLSIEVLTYFDRVRFTRRVGDARMVLRPAAEVLASSAGNAR